MSEPSFVYDAQPAPNGAVDLMTRGALDGAADARAMAERVWSGTGPFLRRFAYTTGYTFSYGVTFPATLLARAIPRDNAAVRGLVDGGRAAAEKADEIRGRHRPALGLG